jgi:hypothetical protein
MRAPYPALLCALWWNCQVSVLTYHNDLARTGQNLSEKQLTPSSVSSGQFGQLFRYPVDGQIYAQPLYLPGVIIPGKGIHNLAIVATEHDSVYAFDADNDLGAALWHVNFLNPAAGENTASALDLECDSISPEVGITATPVIDPATGTLYVVAMTEVGAQNYTHRLHALDVATGAERPGSPVEIQASVPGTGSGNNTVQFEPWLHKERAGLLLLNGTVYTAWSSQCDSQDYHGWLIGYDARTLQQTAVFNTTPNAWAGAFWQGGAAPAADASGNIYVVSANGVFDANGGGSDLAESILKLTTGQSLALADYFAPHNAGALSDQDLDLGSSGALLLPDEAGSAAHPHLLVTGSKSGAVYLLDRDRLGHFQPGADTQIVQSLSGAVGPLFGIPAYFKNTVYFSGSHDQVKAFSIQNGLLSPASVSASSASFALLGTVPSISALGAANGILWTIDPAGQLHAYDAGDLGHQLYQGSVGAAGSVAGAGGVGGAVKFSTPTIANGKVYMGTMDSLVAFGLKDESPRSVTAVVSAGGFRAEPVAPGSVISIFGANMSPRAAVAARSPWPKILEFTSVFINGVAAPLEYVSPTQINAQVPSGTESGQAMVTVVVGDRVLPPVEITVQRSLKPARGILR